MSVEDYLAAVSYQVFARKYRPKTFADVLGQDHVVQTLKNAIEQDRLAHAYLFVGPRGTGKTSTARIFAKALNCTGGPSVDFDPENEISREIAEGNSLDVLEIDGASHNKVNDVHVLLENVNYAPSKGNFKIYYIDEVHMLTSSAFNALLKTLEEPPAHVKFIFATTEPHKILPTIISRCQRFNLRPISTETIAKHLQFIASEENIKLDDTSAWALAKGADGGMRDAQSMLDQLVAFCGTEITEQDVLSVFGFTAREVIAKIITSLLEKNTTKSLNLIHEQAKTGKDLSQLLDEMISCLRSLLVAKIDPNAGSEGIQKAIWEQLQQATATTSSDQMLQMIELFAETETRMKWASNKRLHLEIAAIKAIQQLNEINLSDVITALAGAGAIDPKLFNHTKNQAQVQTTASPSAANEQNKQTEQTQPPISENAISPQEINLNEATLENPALVEPSLEEEHLASINLEQASHHANFTQAEKAPSDTKKIPYSQRKNDFIGLSGLDDLIENAEEESSPTSIQENPTQATPTQANSAATKNTVTIEAAKNTEQSETEESPPKLDETFYKDPLIIDAVERFKGRYL